MAQRLEENKRQIKLFVFTGAIKGLFSWEKSLFCKLKEISGKYTLPLFFSTCFSTFFIPYGSVYCFSAYVFEGTLRDLIEMPTSRDRESGDSLFCTTPPPTESQQPHQPHNPNPPPPHPQIDPVVMA